MTDAATLTEKVATYLLVRRGRWVDGKRLMKVGGSYSWRSRVSDARRAFNLTIENRVRRVKDNVGRTFVVSEYRVPTEEVQQ